MYAHVYSIIRNSIGELFHRYLNMVLKNIANCIHNWELEYLHVVQLIEEDLKIKWNVLSKEKVGAKFLMKDFSALRDLDSSMRSWNLSRVLNLWMSR